MCHGKDLQIPSVFPGQFDVTSKIDFIQGGIGFVKDRNGNPRLLHGRKQESDSRQGLFSPGQLRQSLRALSGRSGRDVNPGFPAASLSFYFQVGFASSEQAPEKGIEAPVDSFHRLAENSGRLPVRICN
jgi:hypothetical protein